MLWKVAWDMALSHLSPKQLRASGFFKEAGTELWYLAYHLQDTNEAGTRDIDPYMTAGDEVGKLLQDLLHRAQTLG